MSRNLSDNFKTALAAKTIYPAYLFSGMFSNQLITLWNGVGPISWNGVLYQGNGWLQNSSGITESEDMVANGMDIDLAGVPSEVLSLVLTSGNQGQEGILYLALLDSGSNIVGVTMLYRGKYDLAQIVESPDTPMVTVSYENHYIDLERPREFRYNPQSQKIWYPNDLGFDFVPKLADKKIFWGVLKKDKKKAARTKTIQRRGSRAKGNNR